MRWIAAVCAMVVGIALAAGGVAGAQTVATIMAAKLLEPNQKTTEVSTEELVRILADGSAIVFDARPHLEWAISHIPGANNAAPKPGVPMSQYVFDVNEILRVVNGDKSKRPGEELLAAGFTNIRRYQLGAPTWRALVGYVEVELDGVLYAYRNDRTAVFVDARSPGEFMAGSIPGAKNIPLAQVKPAKDDGRLPMEDHNTRIIVFGTDSAQARGVAEATAREAFHNVTYFVGTYSTLRSVIK